SVMGKEDYRILVVNDGSKDNTAETAKKEGVIVFSHQINSGLAETFRTEMKEALKLKPEVIVHIDADGQYDPKIIPLMIKEVKKGTDLVLASRFAGKIEEMPLLKKFGNKAFSKVISNITHTKITDAQTGFRAFNLKVAEMDMRANYTYTQEQIIRAIKENYSVKEIPCDFRKRREGNSRLISNPIDYALKAGINLFRVYRDYAPLKFFGLIGSGLFGLGFLIGLWLAFIHLTAGIEGHIALMLLTMILIVTGLQVILFGFLADMKKGN
ncbi:glycosyltransferase family 2 protein, partial [Candidatus Micrarchaeota archaeon]|nr:glycosyltransferase family 2 protein [Candidatus Micrarchaeota archaeon]